MVNILRCCVLLASASASVQDQSHISLLQVSVGRHGNPECKAAKKAAKESKAAKRAAKQALKDARDAKKAAKQAFLDAKAESEEAIANIQEVCPVKDTAYIETKGVSCGWAGGCGGMANQALINNGARELSLGSASDVGPCEDLCNQHAICDGFCLVGSVCYFRKDTECNEFVPTEGRSCWQKPIKGRKPKEESNEEGPTTKDLPKPEGTTKDLPKPATKDLPKPQGNLCVEAGCKAGNGCCVINGKAKKQWGSPNLTFKRNCLKTNMYGAGKKNWCTQGRKVNNDL